MYIASIKKGYGEIELASCKSWDDVVDRWMFEQDDGSLEWTGAIQAIGKMDNKGQFEQLDMDDLIENENREARYERSNNRMVS